MRTLDQVSEPDDAIEVTDWDELGQRTYIVWRTTVEGVHGDVDITVEATQDFSGATSPRRVHLDGQYADGIDVTDAGQARELIGALRRAFPEADLAT